MLAELLKSREMELNFFSPFQTSDERIISQTDADSQKEDDQTEQHHESNEREKLGVPLHEQLPPEFIVRLQHPVACIPILESTGFTQSRLRVHHVERHCQPSFAVANGQDEEFSGSLFRRLGQHFAEARNCTAGFT